MLGQGTTVHRRLKPILQIHINPVQAHLPQITFSYDFKRLTVCVLLKAKGRNFRRSLRLNFKNFSLKDPDVCSDFSLAAQNPTFSLSVTSTFSPAIPARVCYSSGRVRGYQFCQSARNWASHFLFTWLARPAATGLIGYPKAQRGASRQYLA